MSDATKRSQPSRKGKKAWRKNVDIQDIETGLEESREIERLTGSKSGDDGFVIDSTPSTSNSSIKKLKSTEILTNKSKVPGLCKPLKASKHNTIQGVKRTEILRLLKLNGGKYGDESKIVTRIEKDGLICVNNDDLWGEEPKKAKAVKSKTANSKTPLISATAEDVAEAFPYFSSTSGVTNATVIPQTLKYQPIKISENDVNKKFIHAGKSYNPSLESWKALINTEYDLEYKREVTRQQIVEYRERIQHLVETLEDKEVDSTDDEETAEVEVEEEEATEDYSLSINQPTRIKIKTKAKRNREAKHKKRMELEDQLKGWKRQLKDLTNLDEILAAEAEAEKAEIARAEKLSDKVRKPKKLFRYDTIEAPLEVKLSDELTNNLKNLKPEGNLFYDLMMNLQSTGKIETRVPVGKKRKYAPKVTEKWTYKDFK